MSSGLLELITSPSIGLTNLAKPYHVHYHLSQPDMAGQRRSATRRAPASVKRFTLLADVRGNKACSTDNKSGISKTIQINRFCFVLFCFN